MRIGNINQGRPSDYDRNPTNQMQSYEAGVGNHGSTIRWTYTVPSNRKARISQLYAALQRDTAGAAFGVDQAMIQVMPAAGAFARLLVAAIFDNTVGARQVQSVGFTGYVFSGDAVRGVTNEDSTAPSAESFFVNALLHEFDA